MLKKALAVAALMLCAAPLFASVELDTSINDVFNRGTSELAGSITMNVDGDDFRDASTDTPVFIRVTPDHNSFLAETLVLQSASPALFISQPIWLATRLDADGGALISNAMLPEAVSIVRWVEGESSFWIRVQQSSDQWLDFNGSLGSPEVGREIGWTVGITARLSDTQNIDVASGGTSNLPFNTRDSSATELDTEDSTSTLICVNLSQSNLLADGTEESLLNFDIIAFDENAEIGLGEYSGQAGNNVGINFTNDFTIARGKSRECEVNVIPPDDKFELPVGLLCVFRAASNGTNEQFIRICNILDFRLTCRRGGNFLDTELVDGSYINFDTNNNGSYGFDNARNVSFLNVGFGSEAVPVAGSGFNNNGRTLYTGYNLIYRGATVLTPVNISVEVCVVQHFTDDPIRATVDWQMTLVSHDGRRDDPPYDGDDQFRRCDPSQFTVGEPLEFVVGDFIECTGNPAVIFFPYLPRLVGNSDFWVGLSYVNQGGADLDVEAIVYDEDGNRFTAGLGGLPSRYQKTWLIVQNAGGTADFSGAGGNNAGEVVAPQASGNADPDSFGVTRSSMFVRGTFPVEFRDDLFLGDLDGYLLIGSLASGSIDGAYLPRNYDNDIPGQNADLPIWRSKANLETRTGGEILSDSRAIYSRD